MDDLEERIAWLEKVLTGLILVQGATVITICVLASRMVCRN